MGTLVGRQAGRQVGRQAGRQGGGPKSIDSSVSFGDAVIESSESFETKSIDSSVSFVLQQESYMNLKGNASRYAHTHRC